MSKSRKSKKKTKRRPNLSPLSMLRPRLDGLWTNPDWPNQDEAKQLADLTTVTKGIAPEDFLPAMVRAYTSAPESVQQSLAQVIPAWLLANDYVDDLREEVERWSFTPEYRPVAMEWLKASGLDLVEIEAGTDTFHAAYLGTDEIGAQGLFCFFWYADRKQTRIGGISILIDYDPPWEGAAKDVMVLPQNSKRRDVDKFLSLWEERGLEFVEQDAVEAKKELLDLLAINKREGIRLAQDFRHVREQFVRHIFTLPDGPDTPNITLEDFDALLNEGSSTEAIVRKEQIMGHEVRMDDGSTVRILEINPDDELSLFEE